MLIPGMDGEADALSGVDVSGMADPELAHEIERWRRIRRKWVNLYWADLIPFAHGARLFGQFYNDAVRPRDPFEFTALLGGEGFEGFERNRMLDGMAALVRGRADLKEKIRAGRFEDLDADPAGRIDVFKETFGDTSGAYY